MGLLGNIEEKIINQMKGRFEVKSEIVDNKKGLKLVTKSYFDGHLVDTNELDLLPLIEGIKKRL